MKNLICCLTLLLMFGTVAFAQSDRDKMVFGGFTNISVYVSDIEDDVKALGLDANDVKTGAENALRNSGFQVTKDSPQSLYINLKTIHNDKNSYSYAIIIYLDQGVILQRNPNARFGGTTWDISSIATTDSGTLVNDVNKQVLSLIDQFLVKYNSVNRVTTSKSAPLPDEAQDSSPVKKIDASLPPTIFLVNKTGNKVYVSTEGRNYVVALRATKSEGLANGNAVVNARIAGFQAFSPTRVSLHQGEGYTLTFTTKAR